jgi:hypothetical protein
MLRYHFSWDPIWNAGFAHLVITQARLADMGLVCQLHLPGMNGLGIQGTQGMLGRKGGLAMWSCQFLYAGFYPHFDDDVCCCAGLQCVHNANGREEIYTYRHIVCVDAYICSYRTQFSQSI